MMHMNKLHVVRIVYTTNTFHITVSLAIVGTVNTTSYV